MSFEPYLSLYPAASLNSLRKDASVYILVLAKQKHPQGFGFFLKQKQNEPFKSIPLGMTLASRDSTISSDNFVCFLLTFQCNCPISKIQIEVFAFP